MRRLHIHAWRSHFSPCLPNPLIMSLAYDQVNALDAGSLGDALAFDEDFLETACACGSVPAGHRAFVHVGHLHPSAPFAADTVFADLWPDDKGCVDFHVM